MSRWTLREQSDGCGNIAAVWSKKGDRLPRISDQFLECSVNLYASRPSAEGGVSAGGTGFLVAIPSGEAGLLGPDSAFEKFRHYFGPSPDAWATHPHLYIVTNKHVGPKYPFVRITTHEGGSAIIETEDWIPHDTSDLAVSPIAWNNSWESAYKFHILPYWNLLSEVDLIDLGIGIGDDTFCIGRFRGHDGKQRNLPVARFGHIAMMPLEPLDVKDIGPQNVFLIESRIIQGYSGSPVFLSIPPWELRENDDLSLRHALYTRLRNAPVPHFIKLLGITAALVEDQINPKTALSGMMAVIPAWELLELLNSEDLRVQRREELELWRKKGEVSRSPATPA